MPRCGSQPMKVPHATGAVVAASVVGGALTLFVAAWRQSRGGSGRSCPGELGVAGRGVPGRRISGLQYGRRFLCDPRPPRAAASHFGDFCSGDRLGSDRPAASSTQVGLQYWASSDRGGSGTGCEPRYRCSLEFPHRRSDCSHRARGGSVLRHQYVSRGRRCGIDGHHLGRVHQRSSDPGDTCWRRSIGWRGLGNGDTGSSVGSGAGNPGPGRGAPAHQRPVRGAV